MANTEKLYENNSLLKECSAEVLACREDKNGYAVILDRTVIFPEGGGQPSDKGWINDVPVTSAAESDGQVVHYCRLPITVGSKVTVKLDWPERLDHMQQHCGEHLLSYAFWKLFDANNIGFHMNEQSVFIDLDKEVNHEDITGAEDYANEEIWEDKPINIDYVDAKALEGRIMRKKNENITGLLRIVAVKDGDSCTCCGTHPPFTGMVGSIKVIGFERHRGGMRIEFVCGKRALWDARRKYEAIAEANTLLSVKPENVPAAIKKLKEDMAILTTRLKNRTIAFYELRAEGLLKAASSDSGGNRLVIIEEEGTAKEAKILAQVLTDKEKVTVGVFYKIADKVNYLFMSSGAGDCKAFCQKTNQMLGGKGGGNPAFAQGSAPYTTEWPEKIKDLSDI